MIGAIEFYSLAIRIQGASFADMLFLDVAPMEDLEMLRNITAPCSNLRKLRLTLPYINNPYACFGYLPEPCKYPVCRTILSGASPDLRTFTVCLFDFMGYIPTVRRLALWDLEELERPWFRERFPNIEAVVVQLSVIQGPPFVRDGAGDFVSLRAAVLDALPGLKGAGLLKVEEWDGELTG